MYNGPEDIAIKLLPEVWNDQKTLSIARIRNLDKSVPDEARLPMRISTTEIP